MQAGNGKEVTRMKMFLIGLATTAVMALLIASPIIALSALSYFLFGI